MTYKSIDLCVLLSGVTFILALISVSLCHCIMHSQCHLSAPLKFECVLAVKMYKMFSFQFKTSISKSTYSQMQPAFKIILRTYHALTLQSKVNRMKETLESAFSSKIFFFYSVHCLCYLSKKLENTISFPHSFFLFHLENIDFASPCDSNAAQVNIACLIHVQVCAMPSNSL